MGARPRGETGAAVSSQDSGQPMCHPEVFWALLTETRARVGGGRDKGVGQDWRLGRALWIITKLLPQIMFKMYLFKSF